MDDLRVQEPRWNCRTSLRTQSAIYSCWRQSNEMRWTQASRKNEGSSRFGFYLYSIDIIVLVMNYDFGMALKLLRGTETATYSFAK